MPPHHHTTHGSKTGNIFLSITNPNYHSYSGGGSDSFGSSSTEDTNMITGNTGGGSSHENRPPYRAVYFIKKTSANCD
jgi:microcystin-dependent protein